MFLRILEDESRNARPKVARRAARRRRFRPADQTKERLLGP